ncbi:MAG: hypothetical protein ACXADA_13690 [Candidatus Hodarchaeales archaeon]|jgi:hypothetical protein
MFKIRKIRKGYHYRNKHGKLVIVPPHPVTYNSKNRKEIIPRRERETEKLSDYFDEKVSLRNFWVLLRSRIPIDSNISSLHEIGSLLYSYRIGKIEDREFSYQLSILVKRESKPVAKTLVPFILNKATRIPFFLFKPFTDRIVEEIFEEIA